MKESQKRLSFFPIITHSNEERLSEQYTEETFDDANKGADPTSDDSGLESEDQELVPGEQDVLERVTINSFLVEHDEKGRFVPYQSILVSAMTKEEDIPFPKTVEAFSTEDKAVAIPVEWKIAEGAYGDQKGNWFFLAVWDEAEYAVSEKLSLEIARDRLNTLPVILVTWATEDGRRRKHFKDPLSRR